MTVVDVLDREVSAWRSEADLQQIAVGFDSAREIQCLRRGVGIAMLARIVRLLLGDEASVDVVDRLGDESPATLLDLALSPKISALVSESRPGPQLTDAIEAWLDSHPRHPTDQYRAHADVLCQESGHRLLPPSGKLEDTLGAARNLISRCSPEDVHRQKLLPTVYFADGRETTGFTSPSSRGLALLPPSGPVIAAASLVHESVHEFLSCLMILVDVSSAPATEVRSPYGRPRPLTAVFHALGSFALEQRFIDRLLDAGHTSVEHWSTSSLLTYRETIGTLRDRASSEIEQNRDVLSPLGRVLAEQLTNV